MWELIKETYLFSYLFYFPDTHLTERRDTIYNVQTLTIDPLINCLKEKLIEINEIQWLLCTVTPFWLNGFYNHLEKTNGIEIITYEI